MLRVGAVILVALGIVAVGMFSIGTGSRLIIGSETFEAHFHRTNGLQAGAPVSLSGVNIGAVERLHFPEDPHATYVVVKLWVEGSAAARVRTDSVAQIRTMGLLGDKYLELSPGSPNSPPAEPGSILRSEDPLDYEALLTRPGSEDFFANVLAVTTSLRTILEQIEQGHGLIGQLVMGQEVKGKQQVTLASLADTLARINHLNSQLEDTLERIRHGQGLAGALISERTNGRKVLDDLTSSVADLRKVSERLDRLTARYEQAHGMLPRLMEDRLYADQILSELRQSSHDLEEILDKINRGQGTAGALVNDPTLYYQAQGLLAGGGWGFSLMRGLYAVTHPFTSPSSPPPIQPAPISATGTAPSDPALSPAAPSRAASDPATP